MNDNGAWLGWALICAGLSLWWFGVGLLVGTYF